MGPRKGMDVAETLLGLLREWLSTALAASQRGWRVLREKGPTQLQFWLIALLIGIAAGFAALLFRKWISWLQETLYGVDDVRLMHSFAESLPWYMILLIPVAGGLVVGVILHVFTPDGRAR